MPNRKEWFLIFLPLLGVLILRLFGFDGLYGQDGYMYAERAQAFSAALPGAEDTAGFWPPFYPFIGNLLHYIFFSHELALQVISGLSIGLSCFIIYRHVGWKHKFGFLWVLLLFTLSPYLFRSGMLVMSDALTILLVTSASVLALNNNHGKKTWAILLLCSFAVITRFACIPLLFPIALFSIWQSIKSKQYLNTATGLICGLGVLLFVFFFMMTDEGSSNHNWLTKWNISNWFGSSFSNQDGNLQYNMPNLVFALGNLFQPGFLCLGLLSIISIKRIKLAWPTLVLMISVILYWLFLAGIPFQNMRFLLLSYPIVLLIVAPSLNESILKLSAKKWHIPVLGSTLFLALSLSGLALKPMFQRNKLEQEIAGFLNEMRHQETIYSFDVDIALAHRTHHHFVNLYEEKYGLFDQGDLVIFNTAAFDDQWKNKGPMINWEKINSNHKLKILSTFEGGWTIYKYDE